MRKLIMTQTKEEPALRIGVEAQLGELIGTFQSMCERALPSACFDACNKQLKAAIEFHDLNANFISAMMERHRVINQTWMANLAEACQETLKASTGIGQLYTPIAATIAQVNRSFETLRQASAAAGDISGATVAHQLKLLDEIKSRVADGSSELLTVFDREKVA